MAKRVITVADVYQAAEAGNKKLDAPSEECVVTPSALEKAEELGISVDFHDGAPSSGPKACGVPADPHGTVVREVVSILAQRLPAGVDKENLETVVSQVVAAKMVAGAGAKTTVEAPSGEPAAKVEGVCLVSGDRLLSGDDGPVPVAEKVMVADAFDCGDGSKLAGGFMEWEKASFRRTVEQAEMAVVLSGELHLTVGGRTMKAKAGDMLYLPQGVNLLYSAPEKVRLACVNCII